ncbi:hypothetical protein BDV93DRAFT_590496 [Ceratobasidium sp. AG-I]|nr:hypothetical protein BDV93DRAFT_590496 [Ceratobasidium sp. AG-I]
MSEDPSTSTTIPQSLLDKLPADYPLHTLKWSPTLRQPVNLGQAPPVPVGSTRTINLGNFSVLILTPEGGRPKDGWPVYMYMHGGGWVFGFVESGNGIYSRICVVEYRLAPEHPFPAAINDCWEALLWLRGAGKDELGIDISRIAVGGISAGGNFAAVLAQRASLAHIPLVLQLLLIPALNLSLSASDRSSWTPSMVEHQNVWALRTLDVFWFRDLYLPNPEDRTSVDASPLLQEEKGVYEGIAKAWVGVMELDVLRSEGEMYAQKMRGFGVEVVLKEYKGAVHMLVEADGVCELARTIRGDQIETLKAAFAK